MKRRSLYWIAVFLPLLVWSCGGKEPLPDLIPPPPSSGGEQGGQGGQGGSGGGEGGGGTETHPWDANRGKVVRPTAGNGWTVTSVREGITFYAFSGTDVVTGVKQEACAIDLDLSNPNYVVKLTYSAPSLVTSDVFKNHNAIVAMNAGYEHGSIYIRIPDGNGKDNKSDLPNFTISDTGVPNWKSEAAFFCDGVRSISLSGVFRKDGVGDFIRPYKAPDNYRALVKEQRDSLNKRKEEFIISSSPMLIDDYNPVGETFIDMSISIWSSLNSEDPQRHQRQRHPRTAVALTHDNHFIMFVVDGRTTVSLGMSAKELTQFLVKYFNPQYALNMDGGGSTAMCVEGLGKEDTHLVNKPCDSGGRADKQRARDTHFVILAAQ